MSRLQVRRRVDELIAGGARASKPRGSESVILRGGAGGRRFVTLVTAAGQRTAAGEVYEDRVGEPLPGGGFDVNQTPFRKGNAEFIRTRGGNKERQVRRWDPVSREFVYTRLGRQFFSQRRSEYVVSIPVTIHGKRENGSSYEVKSWLPTAELGLRNLRLPQDLSAEQRDERIKLTVARYLNLDRPLYEVSQEQWLYDPDGSWKISELRTSPGELAHPSVINRTVGARPVRLSQLPYAEAICLEAFQDHGDRLCAPRQIAAVLGMELGEVCSRLDEVVTEGEQDWRAVGCTVRMILELAKAMGLACRVIHNGQAVETLAGGAPALVFAVHEDHVYFYSSPGARRALMARRQHAAVAEGGDSAKLAREARESRTPDFGEWERWTGQGEELRAGHYWVEEPEIERVRADFLERGRNPRVVLKDEARVKSLVYTLTAADAADQEPGGRRKRRSSATGGSVVIHALPAEAWDIQRWLARLELNLAYKAEGLANICQKVLMSLLRDKERIYLTGDQKAQLLEQHGWRCALCSMQHFSNFEWDHVSPLSQSFGEEQSFQPLCRSCHNEKSAQEARLSLESDFLASHFERSVWEEYVLSPKPPPLVWRERGVGAEGLEQQHCLIGDVVRCRKRALEFSAHPFPVCSPLDAVEEVQDCTLGDLNLVTRKATSFVRQLGYTGPGWQHRVQTEWLLYAGVIGWRDISHRITATAHYPEDLFRRPLDIMERAWGESGLAKKSVNALIGLWAKDETYSYQLSTSNFEEDAPRGECLRQTFHFEGGTVTDYISKTRLVTSTTHRPLHDLCLCTEAVRVGQMIYFLKQQRATLYEFKTDSVLFRPLKRAPRDSLASLRIKDLSTLRSRFELQGLTEQRCHMAAQDSTELAFRVGPAKPEDLLRWEPSKPSSEWSLQETPAFRWRDLTPTEARDRVVNGEGLLCLGLAGTGKSSYMKELVQLLKAQRLEVAVIAKTHVASSRIGGVTADHWVRRHVLHGACTADVLWVDEVSQLDVGILCQLNKLIYAGRVRFLLSGDFQQFGPVFDRFRGAQVDEGRFEASRLLHRMAGGNRVTLTECRRTQASEAFLFQFYRTLVSGGQRFHRPLAEVIAEAKQTFRLEGQARWNLCISHARRVKINRESNALRRPRDGSAVWLKVTHERGHLNAAQSCWLWPGLELFGCCVAEKKGIRNGILYTVERVDTEGVLLSPGGIAVTLEQAGMWLRLSFAQTYASCQGTEVEGTLRLWDTSSPHFTRRHLYVGLSRARNPRGVGIED